MTEGSTIIIQLHLFFIIRYRHLRPTASSIRYIHIFPLCCISANLRLHARRRRLCFSSFVSGRSTLAVMAGKQVDGGGFGFGFASGEFCPNNTLNCLYFEPEAHSCSELPVMRRRPSLSFNLVTLRPMISRRNGGIFRRSTGAFLDPSPLPVTITTSRTTP